MKNKGITLVSLVVTIVIMLILAGSTIAIVVNSGLIDKAKESVRMYKLAGVQEQIEMEIMEKEMEVAQNGQGGVNMDDIKDIVEKYGELQEDGDTVVTPDGDLSLDDMLNGYIPLESENEKLQETITELEGTIEDLKGQLEREKESKEELEKQLAELESKKQELEGKNASQQGQIADLQQEIEEKNKQLETAEGEKDALEGQIAKLESQKDKLEQDNANQKGQIEDLNQQVADKDKQILNRDGTIKSLQSTVDSLKGQVNSLKSQVADLEKRKAKGTATAQQVLTGYTFSNDKGVGLQGAMTNRGAWTGTVGVGGTLTIPAGYHNGQGKVTANKAVGTATAPQVLAGYTFSNGSSVGISGSMPNRGSLNWSGVNTSKKFEAGYYTGGTVSSTGSYQKGRSDFRNDLLKNFYGSIAHGGMGNRSLQKQYLPTDLTLIIVRLSGNR